MYALTFRHKLLAWIIRKICRAKFAFGGSHLGCTTLQQGADESGVKYLLRIKLKTERNMGRCRLDNERPITL